MQLLRDLFSHRMVRYVFSGGISYVADIIFFVILFYAIHLESGVANATSTLLTWGVNYTLTQFFVFRDQKTNVGKALPRYITLAAFNIVVSSLIVQMLVGGFGLEGYWVKMAVNIVVIGWTYLAYKKFVFVNSNGKSDESI